MTAEKDNQDLELRILSVLKEQTLHNEHIERNIYRLIIHAENSEVIGSRITRGTGFTVFVEERVYLVTAAHLFDWIHINNVSTSISIQYKNKAKKVRVEDSRIGQYLNGEKDVAVFRVDSNSLSPNFNRKFEIEIYYKDEYFNIGDQIIFVGYPSLQGKVEYYEEEYDENKRTGFPRPFLKFGYLSYYTDNPIRFYIDGSPNYGFSGGPVMFRTKNNELRYIGIVSRGADDGGIGGLTMICEPIHEAFNFIMELENRIKK